MNGIQTTGFPKYFFRDANKVHRLNFFQVRGGIRL